MFCTTCGTRIDENDVRFCPNCGAMLGATPNNNVTPPPQYVVQPPLQTELPMKWFKFLINFSLIAGAVLNVLIALSYITGTIYFSQTNGEVTAEMIYDTYGQGVQVLDIIYAVFIIGTAVFGIYTRFMLAKFKAKGPVCLYVLYAVSAVGGLIYNIALCAVTGVTEVLSASSFTSLAVSIGFLLANKSYFDKRKSKFIN